MSEFWVGFFLGALSGALLVAGFLGREVKQETTKPLSGDWYSSWRAKEDLWKKKGNAVKKVKKVK